jgi:hypothetical protein
LGIVTQLHFRTLYQRYIFSFAAFRFVGVHIARRVCGGGIIFAEGGLVGGASSF